MKSKRCQVVGRVEKKMQLLPGGMTCVVSRKMEMGEKWDN